MTTATQITINKTTIIATIANNKVTAVILPNPELFGVTEGQFLRSRKADCFTMAALKREYAASTAENTEVVSAVESYNAGVAVTAAEEITINKHMLTAM